MIRIKARSSSEYQVIDSRLIHICFVYVYNMNLSLFSFCLVVRPKQFSKGLMESESIRLLAQLDKAYAEKQNLLSMVQNHVAWSKERGIKFHLEHGDGAPIDMLFTHRRFACLKLLKEILQSKDELSSDMMNNVNTVIDLSLDEDDDDVTFGGGSETALSDKDVCTMHPFALVMGGWHCFQHSLLRTLVSFKPEWITLASLFRLTWGRLQFFLDGGKVHGGEYEALSVGIGVLKWWYERHRAGRKSLSAIEFDQLMDEDAARVPVLARIRALVESLMVMKGLSNSMKVGGYSWSRAFQTHLLQSCAGGGSPKYTRSLVDFKIQESTMPSNMLRHVMESMYQFAGGTYMSSDWITERIHLYYRQKCGNLRGQPWFNAVLRTSLEAGSCVDAQNIGKNQAPSHSLVFGCFAPNMQIVSKVYHTMDDMFSKLDETGTWTDASGASHGECDSVTIDGATILPHQLDPERFSAAVLYEDVKKYVFAEDWMIALGKRENLPSHVVTVVDEKVAEKEKLLMDTVIAVSDITSVFGKFKAPYVRYLEAYEKYSELDEWVDVHPFERRLRCTVEELAILISQWRSTYKPFCEQVNQYVKVAEKTVSDVVLKRLESLPSSGSIRHLSRMRISERFGARFNNNMISTARDDDDDLEPVNNLELYKFLDGFSPKVEAAAKIKSSYQFFNRDKKHFTLADNADKNALTRNMIYLLEALDAFLLSLTRVENRRAQQLNDCRSYINVHDRQRFIKTREVKQKICTDQQTGHWTAARMPPSSAIGNMERWLEAVRCGEIDICNTTQSKHKKAKKSPPKKSQKAKKTPGRVKTAAELEQDKMRRRMLPHTKPHIQKALSEFRVLLNNACDNRLQTNGHHESMKKKCKKKSKASASVEKTHAKDISSLNKQAASTKAVVFDVLPQSTQNRGRDKRVVSSNSKYNSGEFGR